MKPYCPVSQWTSEVSRYHKANKNQRKSFKLNIFQVTRFDEEGGAVADLVSQKVSEEGKLYEAEEEDFGGINIDKAKMILRAEDKFDKVFQREKIKARKKEEKRKAKEAKKRKPEEVNFLLQSLIITQAVIKISLNYIPFDINQVVMATQYYDQVGRFVQGKSDDGTPMLVTHECSNSIVCTVSLT